MVRILVWFLASRSWVLPVRLDAASGVFGDVRPGQRGAQFVSQHFGGEVLLQGQIGQTRDGFVHEPVLQASSMRQRR